MIFAPLFSHTALNTPKPTAFGGIPAAAAVEWLWVSSPAATFGLGIAADGTVVEAAECAAWLIGADEDEARALLREDDPDVQIVVITPTPAS